MDNTFTEFKLFMISDYGKEENYLREMANKGYHLEKITYPGFYKFIKGDRKDIIYRMDYNNYKPHEIQNYIKMFEDYSWEYFTGFYGWSYFRRDAKGANLEIFSDNYSRLQIVKKMFFSRILPLIFIFFMAILPNINFAINDNSYFFKIFFLFVFLAYFVTIIYNGVGLFKLTRKYYN